MNEAMLKSLLKDLAIMLQDKKVISQIWSDYEMVDNEVFSHLHIKFNMAEDKAVIHTAAKDVHGTPIMQAIVPIKPAADDEDDDYGDEEGEMLSEPVPVDVKHYEIEG